MRYDGAEGSSNNVFHMRNGSAKAFRLSPPLGTRPGDSFLYHGQKQLVLAWKITIKRLQRDICSLKDIVHCESGFSALLRNLDSRLNDLNARTKHSSSDRLGFSTIARRRCSTFNRAVDNSCLPVGFATHVLTASGVWEGSHRKKWQTKATGRSSFVDHIIRSGFCPTPSRL